MNETATAAQAIGENWHITILAIGALGTAAFGIVEGFKWLDFVGLRGYKTLIGSLGNAFMSAFERAYGPHYESVLKAQYRTDRSGGALSRTLRQGVRAGLHENNAPGLAQAVGEGVITADVLEGIARDLRDKGDLKNADDPDEENNRLRLLGRFELAADMRIDAAMVHANTRYVGAMRGYATIISLLLTAIAGYGLLAWSFPGGLLLVLIVGAVAVPVAPVAKDLATALTSGAKALSTTRGSAR